jgi:hypothetical protein
MQLGTRSGWVFHTKPDLADAATGDARLRSRPSRGGSGGASTPLIGAIRNDPQCARRLAGANVRQIWSGPTYLSLPLQRRLTGSLKEICLSLQLI